MSKVQRLVSVIIALYLLLVLIDRFVLVELLVTRVGLSVLLALFEAFAILGVGFAVRGALARSWRIEDADLPRDFLLGYPIFGTLCFLTGTLNVSSWSMAILLVVCGVGGIYILVRRFESRPPVTPVIAEPLVLIAVAIVF